MDGRVEESENITGRGKGDVRKMRGGVGKSEEVDGRTPGMGWVLWGEGAVAGETFQNRLYPVHRNSRSKGT